MAGNLLAPHFAAAGEAATVVTGDASLAGAAIADAERPNVAKKT